MTEEEYFRKNYPDSCYGDRLLSPYWDFFQDGVEFGERQSENQIADIKANCDLAIEGRDIKIKELEKIIEQMQDAKCISCTDLGGMLLKITELEKENEQLKQQIEKMKCCGNCKGVCNSDDVAYFCKNNKYKLWEMREQ